MSIIRLPSIVGLMLLILACTSTQKEGLNIIFPPLSPAEEHATFQIEPGFKIQLVAAEPMVQEPVSIQFDEDGQMWVIEMRGYMVDIEGNDEEQPIGRISVLEDQDGDGEMDKSTIYLDSLVMPRSIGLFKGGALVAENNALWITEDLDGDLKADTKILLDSTYSQNGVVEHTDNGLVRIVDNWYYSAKSRLRYRLKGDEWIRDSTEFRGQWGISQDDKGRLIYNYNWSQLHGDLVPPNYLFANPNHTPATGIDYGLTIDRRVYPIRPNFAVNRGYIPGTLDQEGRLLEFTSACAPTVYRSSLFPQEYLGNIFVMENAGNLVKRNVVKENGNYLVANDPNPYREFLASSDERFRPVNGYVGPDGALYIVDMYRGIIQHLDYMTEYLREQTIQRKLDAPVHMGRIWRVVPIDTDPKKVEKLSSKSDSELLAYLGHTDGWYRDMAQRLLVESNDKSQVPALKEIVLNSFNELGSFHALWTLEGMEQADEEFLFEVLDLDSELMQSAALRMLDKLAKDGEGTRRRLGKKMIEKSKDAGQSTDLQMALSSYALSDQDAQKVLLEVLSKQGEDALIRDAAMSSLTNREYDFLQAIWKDVTWNDLKPEHEIFLEMLTASIVKKADQNEIKGLLALVDIPELGWKEQTVLSSLAIQSANSPEKGFVSFNSEPSIFQRTDLPMDYQRIGMLKSLFTWPGFHPDEVEVVTGSLDASALKQFADGRQKFLVSCASCHGSDGRGENRMGPPLVNSEWVLGDEKRLSLILLHGLEGPIEVDGKKYDAPEILPVMPAHSTMDDASIAAILTYIRNEWGNQAPPISRRTVGGMRLTTQGRVYPWSAEELNQHIENLE
ncbi:c-type cytochrome [Algoriphagus lutimaris]|uniref:DUF7133 domain-containing protein n=1 Tax=Algoriphagus lutimaris TaxID=613197 RepID=UPI00196A6D8A|nr:c-type cytochrome [Algoriphagus lutimaris]MBN3520107.1 c-type cytochrome [Algoriphagus lutimaris]